MARLQDITKRWRKDLETVYRGSCAELSRRVVTRTPVDTGLLRQSWNASKGDPQPRYVGEFARLSGAPSEVEQYMEVVNSLSLGDTYSMANGQPYARRIEYAGHSAQAPEGMMRRSVAEWPQIVKGVVDAL